MSDSRGIWFHISLSSPCVPLFLRNDTSVSTHHHFVFFSTHRLSLLVTINFFLWFPLKFPKHNFILLFTNPISFSPFIFFSSLRITALSPCHLTFLAYPNSILSLSPYKYIFPFPFVFLQTWFSAIHHILLHFFPSLPTHSTSNPISLILCTQDLISSFSSSVLSI